jgi:hypothetical protein
LQLVPVKFSLLERFDCTKRYAVMMGFHHDALAHRPRERKHVHERIHYMLHGVPVVIVEEDLEERDVRGLLVKNSSRFRFCGRECIRHMPEQLVHLIKPRLL